MEERNLNREILIPFSTSMVQFGEVQRRIGAGSRELTKMQYSGLYITADDIENVLPVSKMIERVFEHGHPKVDYEIKVPLARLKLAEKKKRNNQLTLGFIAGISLLVGGIGIMNIMLATVTERTREIGIRRALGARQRHITVQFLVETVVLSTTGGLVGAALGIVGAHVVNQFAEWETIVSAWSVAVSFGLSVLVGIFFGMYPAMSAADDEDVVCTLQTRGSRLARSAFLVKLCYDKDRGSFMHVNINIPLSAEAVLRQEWGDLDQAARDALLIESYRAGKISIGFLAETLGVSRWEAEEWPGQHGVTWNYGMDDLENDRKTLAELFGDK